MQSKGGDNMNNSLTTTLFIGINVSSKTNYVFALDFFGKNYYPFKPKITFLASKKLLLKS